MTSVREGASVGAFALTSDDRQPATAHDDDVRSAAAPGTLSTYLEPWMRRVREVDDATLDDLLVTLVHLRRIKLGIAALGFVGGALSLGLLPLHSWLHALLIYGTLGCLGALPAMGVGSLAVRHLFLKDARKRGLSKSAAMLVLTRANRRARHMLPVGSAEAQADRLAGAVRDWDRA